MFRSPWLAVLVCLLAVTAGCSGLSGEETASPSDTETNTTATIDIDAHVSALRDAGSFSYNRTVALHYLESDITETQTTTARVNVDSGRARYEDVPLGGSTTEGYVAANGSLYAKVGSRFTEDPISPHNVSGLLEPGVRHVLSWGELVKVGSTTIDDISVTEYEITEFDNIGNLTSGNGTTTLESASVRFFVSDAGWIKRATWNLTVAYEDRPTRFTERIEYHHVGETTVTQPEWLSAAKREIAKPDFDDVITRSYRGEAANATLTVTAEKYHHDNRDMFEVENEDPAYDRERAASAYVNVYYPQEAANVTLTISYDESAIASGSESDLAMYWRENVYTFQKLDSTVDTVNNTVTANLNTDGKYYSYVVMSPPPDGDATAGT